jgi:hypothetical protein
MKGSPLFVGRIVSRPGFQDVCTTAENGFVGGELFRPLAGDETIGDKSWRAIRKSGTGFAIRIRASY